MRAQVHLELEQHTQAHQTDSHRLGLLATPAGRAWAGLRLGRGRVGAARGPGTRRHAVGGHRSSGGRGGGSQVQLCWCCCGAGARRNAHGQGCSAAGLRQLLLRLLGVWWRGSAGRARPVDLHAAAAAARRGRRLLHDAQRVAPARLACGQLPQVAPAVHQLAHKPEVVLVQHVPQPHDVDVLLHHVLVQRRGHAVGNAADAGAAAGAAAAAAAAAVAVAASDLLQRG
jgi:hypothetical protein